MVVIIIYINPFNQANLLIVNFLALIFDFQFLIINFFYLNLLDN